MTKLRALLGCLVVMLVLTAASESRAYDFWNTGMWNATGYGVSGNLYGLGIIPAPPYYAVHPPVYYGQRYFRTYGESPYARPARSSRPLIVSVKLIKNPFVDDCLPVEWPVSSPVDAKPAEAEPVEAKPADEAIEPVEEVDVASQPRMIINPYYRAEDEVVQK